MTDRHTGIPHAQDGVLRSSLKFPVVGIGASAGGMVALRRFFEQMPANSGMAFVVILHLSPRHESHADSVLQRCTRMPVIQVQTPTPVQADHVYVISPTRALSMSDGYLRVETVSRPPGRHVAIDNFFRTLADAHMDRAIGVVMSGSGADGTIGLARLKEQGGVAIAQLPEDAEYEDMPRNAIASGRVDFVLPVVEMPAKLLELWHNASRIRLPKPAPEMDHILDTPADTGHDSERALREILEVLLSRTGHDFRHYKRATVLRRIERRMQVNLLADLPAYRDFLRREVDEARALLDDMLIGVTNFFRDREAFEALERDVIPGLFDEREAGPRVWVPGCASGEEAYSLAILLADHADSLASPRTFQVFASDIDEHAIAVGRSGLYPESILTDVPPARLRQFFSKEQNRYRINKAIRDRVLFALHNVLRDPPFSRVDLISCRNLLIYLDRDIQVRLLEMFHFALRPGGLLFLGSSESADAAAQYFEVVDKRNRIFRARAQARGPRPLTMLPSRVIEPSPAQEIPRRADRRGFSFADVHQRVLEYYAPPSLVVDADSNIVHMSAGAGQYLRFSGGEPSSNLMAVVDPALRLELRTTLYQALHAGDRAETVVRIERSGQTAREVRISARPFRDSEAATDFLLVMFEETEASTPQPESGEAPRAGKSDVLLHLEQELQRTKDRLQATIEQSETSNEELKASNEELQAINEELRSATEELETSKEELQSVNEELITVNYELKSKVEETAKINDDLQNFISSTDIATVFVDAGLRIKRYTPKAEFIFNIIPGDVGRCLLDITHRLEYPQLAEDAATAFETLQLIEREISSTDGRWFVVRVVPYRTAENKIDGAVLTFIDTTGVRPDGPRRERADGAAEPGLEAGVIVADVERRVVSASDGILALLGYGEQDLLGRRIDEFYDAEEREAGLADDDFDAADAGETLACTRWYRNRRGDRCPCSVSLCRVQSAGETVAYVLLLRAQPAQSSGHRPPGIRPESEASVTLRDEFLAVMSHELKNPLNLISVNTELAARLPEVRTSAPAMGAVETIRRAIRSQTKIIDDLLDMSRIRTGKLALNPEPVDVGMVVTELVEVARLDAASSGLDFKLHVPDAAIMVRGDAARIEQVIWNLLSNAIKFTPQDGQVSVNVGVEENYVRVRVRDTGQGIDAQSLPRIFDLFGQGTSRALGRHGGLGIGLTLVRQLVELHGGRVEAHSEGRGRGATFTVWLPRFTYPLFGPGETAQDGERMRWDGLSILIVEDDVGTADALAQLLELQGAAVVVCNDAPRALEHLATQPFDVVLSDIGMEGMDGYAFARRVRGLAQGARIALVALSGYARPSDIQEANAAGFDAHLSKPLSMDALSTVMRDALAKRRPPA